VNNESVGTLSNNEQWQGQITTQNLVRCRFLLLRNWKKLKFLTTVQGKFLTKEYGKNGYFTLT